MRQHWAHVSGLEAPCGGTSYLCTGSRTMYQFPQGYWPLWWVLQKKSKIRTSCCRGGDATFLLKTVASKRADLAETAISALPIATTRISIFDATIAATINTEIQWLGSREWVLVNLSQGKILANERDQVILSSLVCATNHRAASVHTVVCNGVCAWDGDSEVVYVRHTLLQ